VAADALGVRPARKGRAGNPPPRRGRDDDIADRGAMQADLEKAHRGRDLAGYYRTTRAIHDRIGAIAGNPLLAQTCRSLNARLHALRFRSNLNSAKWARAVAEHRSMITALAGRDGAALRDLLVRHLHAKLEAVLEEMDRQENR